jgi:hypothetical protein
METGRIVRYDHKTETTNIFLADDLITENVPWTVLDTYCPTGYQPLYTFYPSSMKRNHSKNVLISIYDLILNTYAIFLF